MKFFLLFSFIFFFKKREVKLSMIRFNLSLYLFLILEKLKINIFFFSLLIFYLLHQNQTKSFFFLSYTFYVFFLKVIKVKITQKIENSKLEILSYRCTILMLESSKILNSLVRSSSPAMLPITTMLPHPMTSTSITSF